ncbi:MAG TPA: enoyl-CoA hydratase [Xanthobacteraceae bacterium]|nr:enoyl-CoA hydratase [Xanthobacteraceae bacterium]
MSSAGRIETRLDQRSDGFIAFVTIDNAARLNSMSSALMEELVEKLSELAASADLRALVLTGAGDKAFIGGADIREMSALSNEEDARRFITRLHKCCDAIRAIPVPTIARINGFTLGGGLEIAVSCDVRVAVESAVFGMPEVKLGIPSVIEAALLPTLVGWGRARQIVLFGENFSAQDALSWGLIEQMVSAAELDKAVDQWIDQALSCPPGAIRLQKQLIRQWEDMPLRQAIEAGIDSFTTAVRSGEPATAMRSFLERQRARKATR